MSSLSGEDRRGNWGARCKGTGHGVAERESLGVLNCNYSSSVGQVSGAFSFSPVEEVEHLEAGRAWWPQ